MKAEQVALTAQDGATIAAQWHYDDAAKPRTAIIIAHPTTDWRNHFLLDGLARQGIGALGYCTRFTAREAELILEETLLDTRRQSSFCMPRAIAMCWEWAAAAAPKFLRPIRAR